jgi:hypothetical protein
MEKQQERELTAEEMTAQKEQMLQFYTESLPYLEAQLKYEEYLMKIDEARFKRNSIQIQWAMMMQAQEEELEKGSDFDIDNEPNLPEQGKKKFRKG